MQGRRVSGAVGGPVPRLDGRDDRDRSPAQRRSNGACVRVPHWRRWRRRPHRLLAPRGRRNSASRSPHSWRRAGSAGIRWIADDRPGYGGSTRQTGRRVASAAGDAAAVADALGVDRFAVVGHSGGGPHAFGMRGAPTGRVTAAVCFAGLAPLGADGLDWYAGMAESAPPSSGPPWPAPRRWTCLAGGERVRRGAVHPGRSHRSAGTWAGLGASAARALNIGPAGNYDRRRPRLRRAGGGSTSPR